MSVVPIFGAFVALALGLVGGGAILFRARVGVSAAAILVRALLGLVMLAELVVHPALGVVLALGVALFTWHGRSVPQTEDRAPRASFPGVAAILVATTTAVLRPPAPMFWDESIWLAKARVACEGGRALLERALDPQSELVPRGYPIIAAVLQACFALRDDSLPSLVGGGTALVLSVLALYALLLGRSAASTFEEVASWAVLACTPLAWVHLRSVQLDLPVGLLVAALVLAIERAEAGDRVGLPAAITIGLLLGIKDEGLAGALAVGLALGTRGASAHAKRAAWLAFGALAASVVVFRARLLLAGSANDDHSLSHASLGAILPLVGDALRDASDLQTWGLVPPFALGALIVAFMPSMPPRARSLARVLVLFALALLTALVLGPPQVRDFAFEGTLLDRMGLELLPTAALLIPRLLPEAPRTESTEPRPRPDTETAA
jgi:hypothetical protein